MRPSWSRFAGRVRSAGRFRRGGSPSSPKFTASTVPRKRRWECSSRTCTVSPTSIVRLKPRPRSITQVGLILQDSGDQSSAPLWRGAWRAGTHEAGLVLSFLRNFTYPLPMLCNDVISGIARRAEFVYFVRYIVVSSSVKIEACDRRFHVMSRSHHRKLHIYLPTYPNM